MNAFERWNNKHYYIPQTTTDTPLCYFDALNERKIIWRAALKHVLNDCVLPNGMISHTLIKKELEQ